MCVCNVVQIDLKHTDVEAKVSFPGLHLSVHLHCMSVSVRDLHQCFYILRISFVENDLRCVWHNVLAFEVAILWGCEREYHEFFFSLGSNLILAFAIFGHIIDFFSHGIVSYLTPVFRFFIHLSINLNEGEGETVDLPEEERE